MERNEEQAVAWLRKAAEQGHEPAREELRRMTGAADCPPRPDHDRGE